ncbi:MAG: hypothetical protein SW833_07630 [Cyanobacteriota bacterium]|nr:hypothetical protein [Cyanobacteriota bacterium]
MSTPFQFEIPQKNVTELSPIKECQLSSELKPFPHLPISPSPHLPISPSPHLRSATTQGFQITA